MSTDAKREANRRYLAKMETITIRVDKNLKEQIQAAAEREGKSVQAFILDIMREHI